MAGPGDQLFSMLAQSKGLPSHAFRATEAALNIPGEGLEGLQTGMQAAQNIKQFQMLNTPLGQIWQDPSQIPYGLSPNHTVRDLMTIAPTMQNYIPSGFAQTVAGAYGANTGGGPASPNVPPTPPLPPQTPATPSPTPGASDLAAAGGAGADSGGAFAPGTQTSIQAPAPAQGPAIQIPPGGISRNAMELLQPALKANQEERLAQQRLQQEHGQFEQGQANEESRFQRGKNAEEAAKTGPELQTLGGVKQFISEIEPMIASNNPVPGLGNIGGQIYKTLGGVGTPQMKRSAQINDTAAKLSAVLDKQLAGRFNENEANLLKQTMVPNGNDQPQYAMDKLNKLKAFVGTLEGGNAQAIRNVGSAVTGGQINPIAQTTPIAKSNVQAAIDWANAHPNDPRARAVLAKAQANGI